MAFVNKNTKHFHTLTFFFCLSKMSGFQPFSQPVKPRTEVTPNPLYPTLEQKPQTKYSVPDWFNHKFDEFVFSWKFTKFVDFRLFFCSYAISYDAERSRNVSHQVRQDARHLINETYNESWWNKHDKYDRFDSMIFSLWNFFVQWCSNFQSIGRNR